MNISRNTCAIKLKQESIRHLITNHVEEINVDKRQNNNFLTLCFNFLTKKEIHTSLTILPDIIRTRNL